MKNEFIWNANKTTLVNVAHIVRIDLLPPEYERTEYIVSCTIAHSGTVTLYGGTLEECEMFLKDFHYNH